LACRAAEIVGVCNFFLEGGGADGDRFSHDSFIHQSSTSRMLLHMQV